MKKFIVSFKYLGFRFSAKVMVKRVDRKTVISTVVSKNEFEFLLADKTLIFMQQNRGLELVLLKSDRSFEFLQWNVQSEIVDRSHLLNEESFSLS